MSSLPSTALVVYRGQLGIERSRIDFILSAACRAFDRVEFFHLSPGLGATQEDVDRFTAQYDNVRSTHFLAAPRSAARRVRGALRERVTNGENYVVAVGFSATAFLPQRRCDMWFVNGVPDERLESSPGILSRLAVRGAWGMARLARPASIVVVSEPMRTLVCQRLRANTVVVVPNAVDREVFAPDPRVAPAYITYQGGGSPWQGLERLNLVWRALYALDPRLRFRVISHDPRSEVLSDGMPAAVVDFRSASDAPSVARSLQEARLGFVFRAPGIVNEVSWPMKFGEYLACGAPVVV